MSALALKELNKAKKGLERAEESVKQYKDLVNYWTNKIEVKK